MDIPVFSLLLPLYAGINGIVAAVFFFDKMAAATHGWRIPEKILLGISLPGPFGALAGMILFRHKTRHTRFLLVPVFAFIHIVLIFFLLM